MGNFMGQTLNLKNRINKFDNLKGFAIFLIVLGHFLFLTDYKNILVLRNFIYIFHLPIFFFVAGYFSKIDSSQPLKSFKRLIVPYILFTILYSFFFSYTKVTTSIFLIPLFGLWFLLALFFMKMALPIVNKFKYPLILSIIVALLFGMIKYDGDILGLSRTVVFFPAFLIGFYFNDYKSKLESNYKRFSDLLNNKRFIIVLSVVVLIISVILAFKLSFTSIMMRSYYKNHYLFNISVRFLIISIGIIITLILNRYMTNEPCFLSKWGRNSMAIYIFHIGIYLIIRKFFKRFVKVFINSNGGLVSLAIILLLTIVVVTVLSSDVISNAYNKFIDFICNIFIKDIKD